MVKVEELGLAHKIATIGFIIALVATAIERFTGALGAGDFIIGSATLFLGFVTLLLAFTEMQEGKSNRKQAIELAEKDRRRLRLKEQLEGLYSPLVGIGHSEFKRWDHHLTDDHYVHKKMMELKSKYKFLAEDELKKLLDRYHQLLPGYSETNMPNPADLDNFWKQITKDYESLSLKYSGLTRIEPHETMEGSTE